MMKKGMMTLMSSTNEIFKPNLKLSKSKYVDYLQCSKKLWLKTCKPELADEMDQTPFIIGHKVGEIAMSLFPGGKLIEFNADDPNNIANMIARTKQLIDSDEEVIYEAAFGLDGLLAIADILVKKEDGYHIYEVKSSTEVKDVYIDDASFQYHVISHNDIQIAKINIVIINNQYVRKVDLDVQQLFSIHDVSDKVIIKQFEVVENIQKAFVDLSSPEHPNIDIGTHCNKPYDCQFIGYCWSHIPTPSVFDIQNLRSKHEYYQNGWITFEDLIQNQARLNENQQLQVNAYLNDTIHVNKPKIEDFLDKLYYPLVFLDFETFQPAIPEYDNSRPYQQIPTQFSIHMITDEKCELTHLEYLADEKEDPRRPLAVALIKAIPKDACVLAYNMSFEKMIILQLADLFPDLKEELTSIHQRILDLMEPFQKKHYYTKTMNGSHSIKAVLPALFPDDPELSYKNLGSIKNGSEAMNAFPKLRSMTAEEREVTRKDLLEYCKLDTLAMVKIWEKLVEIAD
jgi:hypothetical protein